MDLKYYQQKKKEGFNIRDRKDLKIKPNNNSSDFVMPSFVHACSACCVYCYVARHNKQGSPMTQFSNLDNILEETIQHNIELGWKTVPNQQDDVFFCYEIGEESDLLSPLNIELTNYVLTRLLNDAPTLKSTFATKLSNKHTVKNLIDCPVFRKGRIRVSLMPQKVSDVLEPGTAKIQDRIKSIEALWDKGYECHINFAPVVMYDTWLQDYLQLFKDVDDFLSSLPRVKATKIKNQMACEIIFLTHHPKLHNGNLEWAPEAEELLWQPHNQEFKTNKRGGTNILRYKMEIKKPAMQVLFGALKKYMPYCRVRYAF